MVIALTSISLVSFYPGGVLTWLALASVLGAILLWVVEYPIVGRIMIRSSGKPSLISRHFLWVCAVAYGGAVAASICLLLNVGSLIVNGDGMNPVVLAGERILYHRKVVASDMVPGRIIAFKVSARSSWGSPGQVVMGRVLAVPGDAMSIRGTHYQVNGTHKLGSQRGRPFPGRRGYPRGSVRNIGAIR